MSVEIANYLTFLIQQSLGKIEENSDLQGAVKSLKRLKHETIRTIDLMQGNTKFKIGVFGPPSRGKSTVLNALIGAKVLPTGPRPGLSKSIVELSHQSGDCWRVKISKPDGQTIKQSYDSIDNLYAAIEKLGTSKSGVESEELLRISGPFDDCELLKEGFILVDTPGAEVAFEGDDEEVEKDTVRALAELDKTHLILFCMRADQIGSRSEFNAYSQDMWLRQPLNVVNFLDRWDDTPSDLRNEVAKLYAISPEKVSLVSALNAFKGKMKKDGKLLDESLFLDLEHEILQHAHSMRNGMRLPSIYEEYEDLLCDIHESHHLDLIPLKIDKENFIHLLQRENSKIAQNMLTMISNSDPID